jgi:hypothetical protein
MPALAVVWSFAKTIFGGVPFWVWPIVALALFAGVQSLRLEHAKAALATAQAAFDSYKAQIATQAAADNAKAIDALRAAQAWYDAAVAARVARLQRENAELQKRLEEIAHVPPEQDGPVADVLCAVFSRLWRNPACAADRGH